MKIQEKKGENKTLIKFDIHKISYFAVYHIVIPIIHIYYIICFI